MAKTNTHSHHGACRERRPLGGYIQLRCAVVTWPNDHQRLTINRPRNDSPGAVAPVILCKLVNSDDVCLLGDYLFEERFLTVDCPVELRGYGAY